MEDLSPSMKFLGRMSQEGNNESTTLVLRCTQFEIEKSTSKPYLGWIDINILRPKINNRFVSFLPQNELIYRKPSVYVSYQILTTRPPQSKTAPAKKKKSLSVCIL